MVPGGQAGHPPTGGMPPHVPQSVRAWRRALQGKQSVLPPWTAGSCVMKPAIS